MRHAVLIFALLLAACAGIEPVEFVGPNGNAAYTMRCSGLGRSLEACYQKAGELCPDGYTLMDITNRTVGVPQSGGGTMVATKTNMALECK